jgi:hypothetical protein
MDRPANDVAPQDAPAGPAYEAPAVVRVPLEEGTLFTAALAVSGVQPMW